MARSTCWILIVFACVAYDQSFGEAACPFDKADTGNEMKRCLGSVGLGDMESGGVGTQNWVQLKKQCSDGSLEQALTCVKTVMDDCKGSNVSSLALYKAVFKGVSIENLRQGVHYICENVDVVTENKECIGRAEQPVEVCVQAETTNFQSEIETNVKSGQLKEDKIWELICGLLDSAFACIHTAFKEACNDKVVEVITTFFRTARPPICGTWTFNSSSTLINSSTSTKLVFSALSLFIVLHFNY